MRNLHLPAPITLMVLAFLLAGIAGDAWAAAGDVPQIQVLTVERKPFAMQSDGRAEGFSVQLWEVLSERLGWQSEIAFADSFSDMLEQVKQGGVDLAIGNISITSARENQYDFSQPVFDAGLQILIPADRSSSSVFAAVFTWEMLGWVLAAILVIFVIGNLMWFFERRHAPYFQRKYRDGLWPSFWYAMHVLVSGGFEEHVPRSVPARILGIALVICSLFIVSAFVAKIASTMTVNELRSDIRSYTDLYGKRVGTTERSTAAAFLDSKSIRYLGFADIREMFSALENGRLDAIVHDAPVLRYFAASDGKGTSRVVGELFRKEKYGILFPQGSARIEAVNRELLSLREDGTYDQIYARWFGGIGDD